MSLDICPHCNEDIDNVYEEYTRSGFEDYFEMNCPSCGRMIKVSAWIKEPEFDLDKEDGVD